MFMDLREEVGYEALERMMNEGKTPMRVVLFLLGLSTEDRWNSTTVEWVKIFLESMWAKRGQ